LEVNKTTRPPVYRRKYHHRANPAGGIATEANYTIDQIKALRAKKSFIYSLMGTCIANQVNPQEWLSDVLNRIQDHNIQQLHELLPHNWKTNKA